MKLTSGAAARSPLKEGGYHPSGAILHVRNEAGETIHEGPRLRTVLGSPAQDAPNVLLFPVGRLPEAFHRVRRHLPKSRRSAQSHKIFAVRGCRFLARRVTRGDALFGRFPRVKRTLSRICQYPA
jgi:hypothetical protein